MLFNSYQYAFFLPIVFLLYWFIFRKNLKKQNILLLISSYFFYACWDWRFLFLLLFSTSLDYFTGLKIFNSSNQKARKIWLWISVSINLGFLGFFKYYNFFIDSFCELLHTIGFEAHIHTISIILPVGISFYTFHGLSYVFDIYNKKISASTNWVNYSLFVAFFPLLVAGPIERATHLLPQVEKSRKFDLSKAVDGLRQILWGLFKKVVIADNCATLANTIFNNSEQYNATTLICGAIFFTFQIYGDFSGYSDIALGTARLFGFELLKNFNFPYFSRDIAEFWRRWHISLSSWFKDYLYIPLGGSKGGTWMRIRNTFIIFIVSGFWHGANWTFLVWGALNAAFIMPSIILKNNRKNIDIVAKGKKLPSITEFLQILFTFMLAAFAWIFFRAKDMTHAINYIKGIFSADSFGIQVYSIQITALVILFIIIEWIGREGNYAIENVGYKIKSKVLRWTFYYLLAILIFIYFGHKEEFIYFQF